jgi:hypothetical protein
MTISRFPNALIGRVLVCAALALVLAPAHAAAQETAPPPRMSTMDDPDGVGRLALEAMAGLYRAGARPTRGLLMVRAQPGDPEPQVRFLRADVPDSVKAAVQPAVAGFLARNRGRPVNVSIKLAEETLAVLAGEWEWGPDQAPVLRNERQFQARIDQIANEAMGGEFSTWAPERGSEYSILISPAGTVLAVSVTESGLGGAQDQVVMEAAHDMRWDPAQLQGQPIPAWKPYRFTLRRP